MSMLALSTDALKSPATAELALSGLAAETRRQTLSIGGGFEAACLKQPCST